MSGVKFFYMSYADTNRPYATSTIDNNDTVKEFLFNREPLFKWESIGSDDSDTITLDIDFGTDRTIDTLILVDTNLKSYTLAYYNGTSYVNILTVTNNTETTADHTFSEVTTDKIRFTMTMTQTVDAEKTIGSFFITKAIGQLAGYPGLDFEWEPNLTKKRTINGKYKMVSDGFTRGFNINFQNHVGTDDRQLFTTITGLTEPILVWPCGGDPDQFDFNDRGYRKEDIFLAALDKGYTHKFTKNLYRSGFSAALTFSEVA